VFLLNPSIHITSFNYFLTHDRNFGENISVTSLISILQAYTLHISFPIIWNEIPKTMLWGKHLLGQFYELGDDGSPSHQKNSTNLVF